jgi:DNA-binding CsgD family transcriptional regulator
VRQKRSRITAELVASAERLLAKGKKHGEIARELRISRYVVRLIERNARLQALCPPAPVPSDRVRNSQRGLDAATIRRVQRMLAVGILPPMAIAREAGVSKNMVQAIACGQRPAIALVPPPMDADERFLPEPIRCSGCHALVSVVPCRACAARRGV